MRPNKVRELWRAGKPAIGGWLSIPSSYSAEIMAHQDFDWLCIDTQHGLIDYSSALPMLQAISTTDTTPIVRVPWSEPSIIMKYLDAGASGVIIPMVSTRAQAQACVEACRYPPVGMRSQGPARATLYAGSDYLHHANEELLCICMIETPQALENLDEIASVPGIDALYIGPSDLSQALGLGHVYDADHPKHADAVNKIREACERHGVVAGIHTSGSVLSTRYIKDGFKFVLLTGDVQAVNTGVRSELTAVRSAM